jgi:hypothetical protein
MLTIGQLAAYAGVTVRAVRHYHQIGLLPEPERDASGYRRYGATASCATRSNGWRPAASRSRGSPPGTAWRSRLR